MAQTDRQQLDIQPPIGTKYFGIETREIYFGDTPNLPIATPNLPIATPIRPIATPNWTISTPNWPIARELCMAGREIDAGDVGRDANYKCFYIRPTSKLFDKYRI